MQMQFLCERPQPQINRSGTNGHTQVRVCLSLCDFKGKLKISINQVWQQTNEEKQGRKVDRHTRKEFETEREIDSHITAEPFGYLVHHSPNPPMKNNWAKMFHISKFSVVERLCGIHSDKRWLSFSHPQCFSHLTLRSWHQLNTGRENPIWARKHWFMKLALWQSAAKHLSTTAWRRVMSKWKW